MPHGMKLTAEQLSVLKKMRMGAVIGEFRDTSHGRCELFVQKMNWQPITGDSLELPFRVSHVDRNTVFALLATGWIVQDSIDPAEMSPFSRDVWYTYNGGYSD